jgi:hypothetical protein
MAGENMPVPANGDAKQLDLAFAREFLDVNRKEIELRSQELSLRKDQQSQSHELSLTSLKEQGADRREDRAHQRAMMMQYLIFAGLVVVVLLGFALAAMWMNREAVVMEALKLLAPFVGGLGAGAFFGYRKGQREGNAQPVVLEDV